MLVRKALEMINNLDVRLEPGFRSLFRVRLEVIHAADVDQKLELQPRVVAEESADRGQVGRLDHDERVEGVELDRLDLRAEFLLQGRGDVVWSHKNLLASRERQRPE